MASAVHMMHFLVSSSNITEKICLVLNSITFLQPYDTLLSNIIFQCVYFYTNPEQSNRLGGLQHLWGILRPINRDLNELLIHGNEQNPWWWVKAHNPKAQMCMINMSF